MKFEDLLHRAKRGDKDAQEEIFRMYRPFYIVSSSSVDNSKYKLLVFSCMYEQSAIMGMSITKTELLRGVTLLLSAISGYKVEV